MTQVIINFSPTLAKLGSTFKGIDLTAKLREIILDFAYLVESYSKQVTPVDTGRLRASIGTSLFTTGIGAIVQPNTHYAGFVHEGTKYMRARPYMQWGVDFAKTKIEGGQIASRLDEELRRKLSHL